MILSLVVVPISSFASPPEYAGGVNNEYEYEEIVFITGEPILFVGTAKITENDKVDTKTVGYQIDLIPAQNTGGSAGKDKLTRKITYVTDYDARDDKGQTIGHTRVSKYSETIDIDGDKYTLKDYQFSKSEVIDNRPAADFYSGNVTARKVYDINGRGRAAEGEAIIDFGGGNVGYKNFWGETETQMIDYVYNVYWHNEPEKNWQGTVRNQVSDSTTKELRYSDNEANFSSFNGGYMRISNGQIVSKYDYDLPTKINSNNDSPDGINNLVRDQGTKSLSKEVVPKIERLIVPKFKDLGGHWAEAYISKLYSLDVFDEVSDFFIPDVAMTREEFTKGIMRASDIRPIEEPAKKSKKRDQEPEVSIFEDISVEDPNYKYIKSGFEKGIINGISKEKFAPKDYLTRAQAITIIVRALGFENKAPTPGYITPFADDRLIPIWAKDSIYMGQEIGLVEGDNLNRINPDDELTRAEASALLVRFLEFLEKDLQVDYRENIILFN